MPIRAISWNLYHGRDFPPDRALLTWRSRLFRISERNETHLQVNRDLLPEFTGVLSGAEWNVALLQECPPRWTDTLAEACAADAHRVLTARNSLGLLRAAAARLNPDLIASNEGGSNLILVRRSFGRIAERRELELWARHGGERRTMAFARVRGSGVGGGVDELCVANIHTSSGARAEKQIVLAADTAVRWATGAPLIVGGDFNLRPHHSDVYAVLERRFGLAGTTAENLIDHLLVRGIEHRRPPLALPPDRREVVEDGLRIRLADHPIIDAELG